MTESVIDRRRVIGAGMLVASAGAVAGVARAADAPEGNAWRPASEPQDAWLDKPGTRHRTVFDTTSPDAASASIGYASNLYYANKKGYGLAPETIGVVIVLRHGSTAYGYNDAIWAKYGAKFAKVLKLVGDDAITATKVNPLLAPPPVTAPPAPPPAAADKAKADAKPAAKPAAKSDDDDDDETTIRALAKKGARFAVCGLATEGIAMQLAKMTGQDKAAVEAELKANLVPGGIIVPAGISAINRAQEHGYTFAYMAG